MSYQSWIGVFGQSSFATGPYSPSSFSANNILTGNGTSAIQASGATITNSGNTLTFGNGQTIVASSGNISSSGTITAGTSFLMGAGRVLQVDATDNLGWPVGGSGTGTFTLNVGGTSILSVNANQSPTINAGGTNQNVVLAPSGSGVLSVANGNGNGNITGGAGNMTIVSGTGNSRTLTFQTTTSGGTATNAFILDASQNAQLAGKITSYNGVSTAGYGFAVVQASGRSTAQTAAVASVASYANAAADGSFVIDANVLITASTTHAFTVTCTYTDEGNTSRTVTMNFSQIGGTIGTSIANAAGAVPYEGLPLHIRVKASTTITVATTGTFTSVTYNVEANIRQVA